MEDARFANRVDAGRQLAARLERADYADPLVLALPRGGVPVAYEVARALRAPLDVLMVRKLGVPGHEELAMGAIATGGIRVVNEAVVRRSGVTDADLERATTAAQHELARRPSRYRGGRPALGVAGRDVIIVDDGLATGATMRAAIAAVQELGARSVTVASPVGAPATCDAMRAIADRVICVHTPAELLSVGGWYHDFRQTTDAEVVRLLRDAARELGGVTSETTPPSPR